VKDSVTVFIALGANLGDARTTLQHALTALASLPLTRVSACSSLYKTAALDDPLDITQPPRATRQPSPDYLNAVAALQTQLTAPELLRRLQGLEAAAGRVRSYRNAPRTLDLDMLLYGSASIDSPVLTLPHPRMMQRAFVLVPLAEVAVQQVTRSQLAAVQDQAIEKLGLFWKTGGEAEGKEKGKGEGKVQGAD
jgi:2-amino-4-hydroxy-6-hydroxymethyldihydropteridine diphosphokinase